MDENVFRAILAMDAYNRGSKADVGESSTNPSGNEIGDAPPAAPGMGAFAPVPSTGPGSPQNPSEAAAPPAARARRRKPAPAGPLALRPAAAGLPAAGPRGGA